MKKTMKKIIAIVLCVLVISTFMILPAGAAYVVMGNNNKNISSSVVTGYYKLISGVNDISSTGRVTFTAQYKANLIWHGDVSYYLDPGTSFSNVPTTYQSKERDWRLNLTSNGGCYAYGTIVY